MVEQELYRGVVLTHGLNAAHTLGTVNIHIMDHKHADRPILTPSMSDVDRSGAFMAIT